MCGCARTTAEELGGYWLRVDGPSVRGSLWRVASIEAFAASVELMQEFVGVLARTHSRRVHFDVLRSERFSRTAVEPFAKGGPRTWPVS